LLAQSATLVGSGHLISWKNRSRFGKKIFFQIFNNEDLLDMAIRANRCQSSQYWASIWRVGSSFETAGASFVRSKQVLWPL
jgi:hypothetical protein